MDLLLAWRNIWRNPRRTTVILLAVSIGIWSMVFLGAIIRGIAVDMIQNGIATLTGHIQIHHKEYLSNPVIENSITDLGLLEKTLENRLPKDSRWAARIRVNAVAKNARHTGGVTLVGIDPQREKLDAMFKAIQDKYYNK